MKVTAKQIREFPEFVQQLCSNFKQQHKCRRIFYQEVDRVYINEDATLTVFNPATGICKVERASGEWNGPAKLECNQYLHLPEGIFAVEKRFFCGVPSLNIYSGKISRNRLDYPKS